MVEAAMIFFAGLSGIFAVRLGYSLCDLIYGTDTNE